MALTTKLVLPAIVVVASAVLAAFAFVELASGNASGSTWFTAICWSIVCVLGVVQIAISARKSSR